MDIESLLNLLLGSGGALVALALGNFVQYRQNSALREDLEECQNARLTDLKEGEMLAKAYLRLREREQE